MEQFDEDDISILHIFEKYLDDFESNDFENIDVIDELPGVYTASSLADFYVPVNNSCEANQVVTDQSTSGQSNTGNICPCKRVATITENEGPDKKKVISNERLTQLMSFSRLFQDCLNSADIDQLRSLMAEYCLENLSF